nr:BNR-4 repeat-containing protein [Streptomyces bungoensis]
MRRRTRPAGFLLGAVTPPAPGTARAAGPGPSVKRAGTTALDAQAVYFVSYDGLMNDNSFQKNGLLTHQGTTGGSDRVAVTDAGPVADPLNPDHSLMNRESRCTDSAGLPHAIISYVPGRFGRCTTDHVADRTAHGRAFHVRRKSAGTWPKTQIVPLHSSRRTELVLDRYDNAYAVLPYGRIAGAAKASGHTDWTLLCDGACLNAFGEVVIDETRVKADDDLSFLYQERSGGTTPSPLHVVDFELPS